MHFVPLLCPVAVVSGSRWEPPFPGASLTQGLTRVRENTAVLVCGHTPARLHPAACRLPTGCSPLCPRSKEGVWAPPWPCNFTPVRDACRCCLGFASHLGRARKRHYLCLQTCHTFILRLSAAPALDFVTTLLRLSSSPALKSEQGACESVKSAERKSFLTYLLHGGDVAHGKPLSLSSPPSSTMCLAPAACPPRCPQAPAEVPQPQVYCWPYCWDLSALYHGGNSSSGPGHPSNNGSWHWISCWGGR